MTEPSGETPPTPTEPVEHGRVGYGNLARYSPAVLAVVMVVALIFIALNDPDKKAKTSELIGLPAPDLVLTGFDGTSTSLGALEGNVVVLNFWAAWCEPCEAEMPAFEAVHQSGAGDVRIIGVDIKNDRDENAHALIEQTGVTYQIAKDSGGSNAAYGPVEQAFGLGGSYPVTVFITPAGLIDAVRIGELNESDIRDAIDQARDA